MILRQDLEVWTITLLLFFVALGVEWLVKIICERKIKNPSLIYFLEQNRAPVRVLAVLIALGIATQTLPPEIRQHNAFTYGWKLGLILLSIWFADRALRTLNQSNLLSPSFSTTSRALMLTLGRILIFSIGLLIVLDTLGVSITPILASLGVGSVAVALALQDTLSNVFSGIYLLMDRPIRIGDFVQIDGANEGYVTKIGWRSTHVRLLANNVVVVPNSKVASSKITNYDFPERECSIVIQVGVDYTSDLEKVERITIEVAQATMARTQGSVTSFTPFIRYHTFADSSINFSVILRVMHYTDNFILKHEFIKALQKRYAEEGIIIPFPQRTVHMLKN